MACFKALSLNSSGLAEENHKKVQNIRILKKGAMHYGRGAQIHLLPVLLLAHSHEALHEQERGMVIQYQLLVQTN